MIKFRKAQHESRSRDRRRGRFVLQIGERQTHLTREESLGLLDQMEKRLGIRRKVRRIVLVERAGYKSLGVLMAEVSTALLRKTGRASTTEWMKGTQIVLEYPR